MSDYKLVPVELLNRLVAFRIGPCFDAKGTYTKRKAEEYDNLRDELAGVLSVPTADLSELRGLVEKWKGDKRRRTWWDDDGTKYLSNGPSTKECADELEALIERMEKKQ